MTHQEAMDLIRWSKPHKGSLRVIQRNSGYAFLYRFRENNSTHNLNFPAGSSYQQVKSAIEQIELRLLAAKGLVTASKLSDIWNLYLNSFEASQLSETTIYHYKRAFDFFEQAVGDRLTTTLSRNHLDAFCQWLTQRGYQSNGIAIMTRRIQTVFRVAEYHQWCSYPFHGFRTPKQNPRQRRPLLTFSEMNQIDELIPAELLPFWKIARLTAMRMRDVVRIESKWLTQSKTLLFTDHKNHLREIPVVSAAAEIIAAWNQSVPCNYDYLKELIRNAILKFKGKDFTPCGVYTSRHSFLGQLRALGWPWENIVIVAGHKNQTMTANYTGEHHMLAVVQRKLDELDLA